MVATCPRGQVKRLSYTCAPYPDYFLKLHDEVCLLSFFPSFVVASDVNQSRFAFDGNGALLFTTRKSIMPDVSLDKAETL
jgi:hypothetical protein